MAKFFAKKVWIVPGNDHKFRSEQDAKYYCESHDIDFETVQRFDSIKEYDRWRELLQLEREGVIQALSRQVEYEIIPAHYERKIVRYKTIKRYCSTEFGTGVIFATKKDAKKNCMRSDSIRTIERTEPVYKDVCIEKPAVYTADFVYEKDGELVVEDVKSDYTRKEADYVLRRKLMLEKHGIKILET